jgi:exosortase/archaeosortase family protein
VNRLATAVGLTLAALAVVGAWPAVEAALTPLGALTARTTAALLASLGLPVVVQGSVLVHGGGFACAVGLGCTALTPAALLAAAILSQPLAWAARIAGAAAGAVLVAGVNQLRLAGLVWLGVFEPGWFEAAHLFLGPMVLVLACAAFAAAWLGWAAR